MTRLLIIPSSLEIARLVPDARDLPAGTELLPCGIGLLHAGLVTAGRLSRGDVTEALLVGLAGTRDPALAPLRALVVGTAQRNEAFGAGHGADFAGLAEMGLRGEGVDAERLPLMEPACGAAAPENGPSERGAAGGAEAPSVVSPGAVVVRGVLGSVAAASSSPAEAAAWRARHPDVLAEEMEGYAVALACARAGVPLASVRAISNEAGQRSVAAWDIEGSCAALRRTLPALLAGLLAASARVRAVPR